jgi:hypothetical protein
VLGELAGGRRNIQGMQSEDETPSTSGHGSADSIVSAEIIDRVLSERLPPLKGDITFENLPAGYEVWYSDRIERDHPDLVDQSADFLEDDVGVLNLGQVDHRLLIADGILTDEIRNGLVAWWAARVSDLNIE